MRRALLLVLPVLGAIALSGCPAKPKSGECKSSQDCASQEGFGKICVEGRCQECGADTDCKDGFVCRSNRCEPKPQCTADADCPAGQACQGERCVAKPECAADADCGAGRACESGKCVTRETTSAVQGACADPAQFTITFGFDQSNIASDAQSKLQQLADCLKKSPAKRVVIAGNCDERGTTQYNLALGNRRAQAAKKYLGDLGVGARVDTVSYGKEKPVCTESSEACWARNRRDDFQIER